jgi:glycerol uptake facilitator protein
MSRQLIGELIAEAIAMLIIIVVGCSVAAMYLLYAPSPYQQAYWGVCVAWGLGVTIAIYATGSISGTHANPAVTLALALFRGFCWRKVLPYWLAQVLGAFIGAALVYHLYGPVIDHFNQAQGLTRQAGGAGGVFFTAPGLAVTPLHALGDQVIMTALLVFGIFAITEQYNEAAPSANSGALMIGLLVATIGASMGYLEGWAINPARDFGPRLFAYVAGWGESALPGHDNYWWVPIIGPLLGGVVGGAAYQWLIYPFLPARLRKLQAGQPAGPAQH